MASNHPSTSSNTMEASPANSTPSTIISNPSSMNEDDGSPTPPEYKRRYAVNEPETPLPISPISPISPLFNAPVNNAVTPSVTKFRPSVNVSTPTSPTTVADHPAYVHLYANDDAAIVGFILHGEPLSYEHVKALPQFVAALLAIEPGLPVSYDRLPEYLRYLRESIAYSSGYVSLAQYFNDLLVTHNYWLRAALEYYSYDIYVKMIRGLFLTRSDPGLLYQIRNMSPGADELFRRTSFRVSQDSFKEDVRRTLTHRRVRYDRLLHNLIYLKCKLDLARNLRSLNVFLVRHDHEKRCAAIARGRENAEREARRRRVKARMLENLTHQFGMLGTQNMDPQTEAVVLDVHEQGRQKYVPSYTQQMWEDEQKERERQTEQYGFMRGFEVGIDSSERSWGYGQDDKSGVWFGQSRIDI